MNIFKYTIMTLVFIGALNWGLVGFFDFNLVEFIFGDMTLPARIVYAIIGISAIVGAILCFYNRRYDV